MNNDKTSATVKSLIEEYRLKALRNHIGAPIHTKHNRPALPNKTDVQNNTLVQSYLNKLGTDHYNQPYIWQDLIISLHQMPILAWEQAQQKKSIVETNIAWSSPDSLRLREALPLIGATAIREKNAQNQKRANQPLTVAQTALLHCYQASPRPVAWAMQGMQVIDMLAWMYQDVIAMDLGLGRRLKDFDNNLPAFRDWLKRTAPRSGNTPLRHFRVHLAACLGVSTNSIERVIHGQSDYALPILLQKLMEREGDKYYSAGVVRHFKEVRNDFNLLSEYAIKCQYGIDSIQDRRINQIKCPSLYDKSEFKHLSLRVSHK